MSDARSTTATQNASTAPGLGSDEFGARVTKASWRWRAGVRRLRRGQLVADSDWDVVYPTKFADVSMLHWSPVAVARRAANLLSRGAETRVLDVGAGVGKFCVVAALTSPGLFVGVERSGEMVEMARETASCARTARTRFVHGRIEDIDWGNFNGFYLFNPFAVIRWPDLRMGGPHLPDHSEYLRLIAYTQARLVASRSGTRVVTYFGFGGDVPKCFRLTLRQPCGNDFIECWERE